MFAHENLLYTFDMGSIYVHSILTKFKTLHFFFL